MPRDLETPTDQEAEILAMVKIQDPWQMLEALGSLPIQERSKGYNFLIPLLGTKTPAERDVLIQQMRKTLKVSTETIKKDLKVFLDDSHVSDEISMAVRVVDDDWLAEEVYNPEAKPTERYRFALWKDGDVSYVEHVERNGTTYAPVPSKLAEVGCVLFPTHAAPYKSETRLFQDVRHFLWSYIDIPNEFLNLASYYVLLTWIYDRFSVLPYLRVLGDWGVGKSRVLEAVGSLCYLPIFAAGATTPSPIFRVLNLYAGTLVFDEADFSRSDHSADTIKILNVGYQNRFPVLRSERNGDGNFDPTPYRVFGPKIIASRHEFQDRALESRCFTHVMTGGKEIREGIPLLPTQEFITDSLLIRNKLLRWRFDAYWKAKIDPRERIQGLEARLNQIMIPMRSVMTTAASQKFLGELIQAYQVKMTEDRGVTLEAIIAQAVVQLRRARRPMTFKAIREFIREEDEQLTLSNSRLSGLIRKTLSLPMHRHAAGMVIQCTDEDLVRLQTKYGL